MKGLGCWAHLKVNVEIEFMLAAEFELMRMRVSENWPFLTARAVTTFAHDVPVRSVLVLLAEKVSPRLRRVAKGGVFLAPLGMCTVSHTPPSAPPSAPSSPPCAHTT